MMCETCEYYRTMWWEYPCIMCEAPTYTGYKESGNEQDDVKEDRSNACQILEWRRDMRRV